MTALIARARSALSGRLAVPGDKSNSHRAAILGALAVGPSAVEGLLEGRDVLATIGALEALGVAFTREGEGRWRIDGVGIAGLRESAKPLDLGNSGTGVRLLMGVAAGQPMTTTFCGDASLSRRPMARVMGPLERMGARILARAGGLLPVTITGPETLLPLEHRLEVPSAQVKSAILLAGLSAPGETIVIEPERTRDHTERMLKLFGARVAEETAPDGTRRIRLAGEPELLAQRLAVPGDISSAAFPLAAALARPGSRLTLENVGVNPLRTGLIDTLAEMGARLRLVNERQSCGEPVADIEVEASPLKGVEVPPERAPRMIDEYPVLAVLAAGAEGRTVMRGLSELRVKESDRLAAIARGLEANGVRVEELPDGLIVEGLSGRVPGGGVVATHLDHRIAMAFLTLGLSSERAVTVDDASMIETSFPGFVALMNALGAEIAEAGP